MSDSYETIRQRIINRIPQDDDIREGSPIVIAVDPVARELSDNTLIQLEDTLKQSHPLTADREYLLLECELYGITPYPATPAIGEGKFDIECAIGDRFTLNGIVFRITEESPAQEEGFFFYYLECEKEGDVGNMSPGKLIPVTLHQGLTYSQLIRITINGENEEDTESLRARLQALKSDTQSYGGNVANYYTWLSEVQGVGRAKVIPLENPEGEIKDTYTTLVITDSNNAKPSEELIQKVQEYINPRDFTKQGLGKAPIGADVYVVGVKEEVLNLSFTVENEAVSQQELIKKALEEYFNTQNLQWGNTFPEEKSYYPKERGNVHIRIAQLINAIFTVPGVINVTNMRINGDTQDINLAWDTIAKLGEIDETDTTPSS